MNRDIKAAAQAAIISAMRTALADPETDIGDHVLYAASAIGFEQDDHTVNAHLDFPDQTKDFLPSYRSVIRVTPRAHATLSHRNQDTRDEEPCGLTDQEQEILNDYATKAAFHLTGIANGQLLKENIEDMAYTADIDDVFDQLQELIVDASVLSEELSARLTRRVNVDDWIPDDWNSTLSVTIDSCIQTAKLLIESIIDPPEPEGPEVPDHPDSPE